MSDEVIDVFVVRKIMVHGGACGKICPYFKDYWCNLFLSTVASRVRCEDCWIAENRKKQKDRAEEMIKKCLDEEWGGDTR